MRILTFALFFLFTACSSIQFDRSAVPSMPLLGQSSSQGYDRYLTGFEYPFEVKYFGVEFMGEYLPMAFMDISPDEGKQTRSTVVLFHGKNFNGAYWERTAKDLLDKGHRVIIPDQIGFGKSAKPLDYQYSFHALADNTRRLLDSLEVEEVALVGHSMGGMVATRFALMFPERVELLAMVNPIGLEDWKRKVDYTPLDTRIEAALKKDRDSIVEYQRVYYYDGNWSEEFESYARHLIGWTEGRDREHMALIDALTVEMVFTQPVLYEFDLILAPTLLILGTRDRTALGRANAPEQIARNLGRYDRLGVRTCNRIARCRLIEFDNIGHMPQVEDYRRYISALSAFLNYEL